MTRRRTAVLAATLFTLNAGLLVGASAALAQQPSPDRDRTGQMSEQMADQGRMGQMHSQMVQSPEMREMHRQMTGQPGMGQMHSEMVRQP